MRAQIDTARLTADGRAMVDFEILIRQIRLKSAELSNKEGEMNNNVCGVRASLDIRGIVMTLIAAVAERKSLSLVLFSLLLPQVANASFIASDFSITGFAASDYIEPGGTAIFQIELTNNSNETAVFGENIMGHSKTAGIKINNITPPSSWVTDTAFLDITLDDFTLQPGESRRFDYFSITVSDILTAGSIITFHGADLAFWNIPDSVPYDFSLNWSGNVNVTIAEIAAVPLPLSIWLFGSGIIVLSGCAKRCVKPKEQESARPGSILL